VTKRTNINTRRKRERERRLWRGIRIFYRTFWLHRFISTPDCVVLSVTPTQNDRHLSNEIASAHRLPSADLPHVPEGQPIQQPGMGSQSTPCGQLSTTSDELADAQTSSPTSLLTLLQRIEYSSIEQRGPPLIRYPCHYKT